MSWDDLYADEYWRKHAGRAPLQLTLDWIASLQSSGLRRVYDMGCGLGRHTVVLAGRGFDVVAADTSARARAATKGKLAKAGFAAEVIDADMTSIPFPDGQFDAVLAVSVLEHNTRAGVEKAISEIFRVLGARGRMLATFCPRNRWIPKDDPKLDMIEDNTLKCYGPEECVHHLVDEGELRNLFAAFAIESIGRQEETWDGGCSAELFISAQKR